MVDEYITAMRFRYVPQWLPLPDALTAWAFPRPMLRSSFEMWNTKVPHHLRHHLRNAAVVADKDYMSTIAIGGCINCAVSALPDNQCYLNIGVWNGFSFLSGMIGNANKHCIGVDNFSEFGGPRTLLLTRFKKHASAQHVFVEADFRKYLMQQHKDSIGVYFYDGHHSFEDQYDSLRLAEPYFAEGCLIIVDDTNWPEPRMATEQFLRERPMEYKCVFDGRTPQNRHPTLWNGLMILRKKRSVV